MSSQVSSSCGPSVNLSEIQLLWQIVNKSLTIIFSKGKWDWEDFQSIKYNWNKWFLVKNIQSMLEIIAGHLSQKALLQMMVDSWYLFQFALRSCKRYSFNWFHCCMDPAANQIRVVAFMCTTFGTSFIFTKKSKVAKCFLIFVILR